MITDDGLPDFIAETGWCGILKRSYQFAYWLLFFAVLTNIDLGITVGGLPLNLQRLVFVAVGVFLVVEILANSSSRARLPYYSLIVVSCYASLLVIELTHVIRLHEFSIVTAQFGLTLCLVLVLSVLRFHSARLPLNMFLLGAIFVVAVVVTIMLDTDVAAVSRVLVLEDNFHNSMRLRSGEARNIVNSWAAGVVIAFVLFNDLSWQHSKRRTRRILLLVLAVITGLVTLLSASRAALLLFVAALVLIGVREMRHGGTTGTVGALFAWAATGLVALEFLRESAMFLRLSDAAGRHDDSILKRLTAFSVVAEQLDGGFFLGHGEKLSARNVVATENTFLGIAHRYGFVGLAVYASMWLVIVVRAVRSGGFQAFLNSLLITFLSLLTNDLLFFPLALFVIIEVLQFETDRAVDRLRSNHGDGGAQPA